MILVCGRCDREVTEHWCDCWHNDLAACGVWGGTWGQVLDGTYGSKDTSDETKPNISTPEIDALYPKPDPVAELSEQEKERIWETLKQAARG